LTQKTADLVKQHYLQFLNQCKEIKDLKNEGQVDKMKEKEGAASLTFVQVKIPMPLLLLHFTPPRLFQYNPLLILLLLSLLLFLSFLLLLLYSPSSSSSSPYFS
jgi:hypothetical protein